MRTAVTLLLCCAASACAERATVQVLSTTDLHGTLLPYDYYAARPADRGLAKVATLIERARAENPHTLLVDTGDTIQGSPLETVYQSRALEPTAPPDPMMLAMNAAGYDAMVLGNHEFNFGLARLEKARSAAHFPWLSANTQSDGSVPAFRPYIVKTIAGVKIAFIGITTPAIPNWEQPENYKGYSWTGGKEAAAAAVREVRAKEKPDLVIIGAHTGLERNPATGAGLAETIPGEDMVYAIAGIPGIDAVLFGHTHQQLPATRIGDTLVIQPKNWGASLAQLRFTLERDGRGPWRLVAKEGRLLPVSADVSPSAEIVRIAQPYHDRAEAWLNRVIAQAPATLRAARARIEDTAILDAVQKAQLHFAKADVSLTAVFNTRAAILEGPVTVRQIAGLYIYDNELYAIEGSGRMLREALENAARYFNACEDANCINSPLINRSFFGFNFDVAEGVSYEIDLTQPAGRRIRNLQFRGRPLSDDQPLRIAINNYRAAGSAGYSMFKGAKVLWRSSDDIRDLIIRYYSEGHPIPTVADGNWRIVPGQAHSRLAAEADSDTRRTRSM